MRENKMSDKNETKERAKINRQLASLYHSMEIIKAKETKSIWSDPAFDCDRKDTLRNAELTLRLSQNTEYQSLQAQVWDLEEKLEELGNDLFALDKFDKEGLL